MCVCFYVPNERIPMDLAHIECDNKLIHTVTTACDGTNVEYISAALTAHMSQAVFDAAICDLLQTERRRKKKKNNRTVNIYGMRMIFVDI